MRIAREIKQYTLPAIVRRKKILVPFGTNRKTKVTLAVLSGVWS
jgi:hypothetical protein